MRLMSNIRFPDDKEIERSVRRFNGFWYRLRKKQEAEREKKERDKKLLFDSNKKGEILDKNKT